MDDIDRRIVAALQRDGRITNVELAELVGLSPTPCARRVARLEAEEVITGYGARVDPVRVGLPVSIFVSVELERQDRESITTFERAVVTLPEVMECYLMTGSRDILLRVVAEDLTTFNHFLEERLMRLPGIRSIRSNFALRTLIRRQSLPLGSNGS